MFLYGKPSTQKTLIFYFLSKVLRIYFASARRNDFTGANNYYDLWLFDEFHEPDEGVYGAFDSGTPYFNTLLRILDGQECRLDSKYSRVFTKKKNVPIVMIANEMPRSLLKEGPLKERFFRMCFRERILNLKEERVIATLWGCIQRRLQHFLSEKEMPNKNINLAYNHEEGTLLRQEDTDIFKGLYQGINGENAIIELFYKDMEYCYTQCSMCEEKGETCVNLFYKISIEGKRKKEGAIKELSLLDFLIIPIKKMEIRKLRNKSIIEAFKTIPVFNDERYSALIFRRKKVSEMDYAVWPIQITFQDVEESIYLERNHGHKKSIKVPATIFLIENEQRLNHKKRIKEASQGKKSVKVSIDMGPMDDRCELEQHVNSLFV